MNLDKLKESFPWPATKPDLDFDAEGWLHPDTEAMLARVLPGSKLAIEIGTWMGLSARHMLERNPELTLICVDTWLGSLEHFGNDYQNRIPRLYEQFITNCWDFRDRIVPVRLDSMNGLKLCAEIMPDFIYLDGGHAYEVVGADLRLMCEQWPAVPVVLDDYIWPGPERAVSESGRTIVAKSYSCLIQ